MWSRFDFSFYSQEQQSTRIHPDHTNNHDTPDPDAATHPEQDHDKSLHPHPDQDNLNSQSHDAEHVSEDPDHVNLSSHSLDRGGVLGIADLVDGNPNYPSYEPGRYSVRNLPLYKFFYLCALCSIKGLHSQLVNVINHID